MDPRLSFIHRMQFFFIQYATYHSYNANVFLSTFHPYFATFFSIFHCQMLHIVDKKLQNGWIIVHFLHNFHWTTWSRGIQVLPLGGSCNSVFLWQPAWGNYTKITPSISPVHKLIFFEKHNYILDFEVKVELLITSLHFFPLKELCKKIFNALIIVQAEQLKNCIVFLLNTILQLHWAWCCI
jgi:hypothetical protein